jgi:tRNA(adenine34) deaminase
MTTEGLERDPDVGWMAKALDLAARSAAEGEVPVGAVVVHDGLVIGSGRNLREGLADPTAHAELLAIREAARALGSWRLDEATLVVTLEPCPMCAGALVNARVQRLVYGCADPKAGAVATLYTLCSDPRLNHRVTVRAGVCEAECAAQLRSFFAALRSGERPPKPRPDPVTG